MPSKKHSADTKLYIEWVKSHGSPKGWDQLNQSIQNLTKGKSRPVVRALYNLGYIPARSHPYEWRDPPGKPTSTPPRSSNRALYNLGYIPARSHPYEWRDPPGQPTSTPPRSSNNVHVISTPGALDQMISSLPSAIAIDCVGVPDRLSLVQIACPQGPIFVCDGIRMGEGALAQRLCQVLENPAIMKLMHDLYHDVWALHRFLPQQRDLKVQNIIDTQLVAEYLCPSSDPFIALAPMLELLGQQRTDVPPQSTLLSRPLDRAIFDVKLLLKVDEMLPTLLPLQSERLMLLESSAKRASESIKDQGKRQMFINRRHRLTHMKPQKYSDYITDYNSLEKQLEEYNSLLKLLPEVYQDQSVHFHRYAEMVDFIFDKGTEPYVLCRNHERLALHKTAETTEDPIEYILEQLRRRGVDIDNSMQNNNRIGLDGQLHRISLIRNRSNRVYGITLRIGRAVYGQANTIIDLLTSKSKPSILVLGPPGTGKTTLIREMARITSEFSHVCVVDTSNEIGGNGDTPHSCLGRARRMMVRSLAEQADVMIECVQNHTISTMIIDEIGRRAEVNAANTIKQRGVQIIASAHGTFDQLISNRELNYLMGGVETVTLGDAAARTTVDKMKVQQQRVMDPVFDIIIELEHSSSQRIKIISNVAQTVDLMLKKQPYAIQYREPGKKPGKIKIELKFVK